MDQNDYELNNFSPALEQEQEQEQEPEKKKRRGGRKPMSPEEKLARAEERKRAKAEEKKRALEEEQRSAEKFKTSVYVQYQDSEADSDALAEAAEAEFKRDKPRTKVRDMKLYIKPEERTAYYVINGTFAGKVEY